MTSTSDPLDQLPSSARRLLDQAIAETPSGRLKLHIIDGVIVAITMHEEGDDSGRMLWASAGLGDAG